MKKNSSFLFLPQLVMLQISLLAGVFSFSQSKKDTLLVTPENVHTKVLQPGMSRYLVYFKMGRDAARSRPQFWTRNIEYGTYEGREAIIITQEWEDRDSIVHRTKSVCDKKTFASLYHNNWWKQAGTGEFDFISKTASLNEKPLSDNDTARMRKYPWEAFKTATSQYTLNWHLDMEVFPILDYKAGRTFLIPFYDPGLQPPKNQPYTITGSAMLPGYNGQQIDCWLLEHGPIGNRAIFWISKKTKTVLKLEEEIGKDKWRYKIKLGFSV